MRLTQGTFSFLPDLTDEQIAGRSNTAWARAGRSTSNTPTIRILATRFGKCGMSPCSTSSTPPRSWPRSPPAGAITPSGYIKVNANDSTRGRETVALSFIVNRPEQEPGFRLDRQEAAGRSIRYTIHSYAADRPEGRALWRQLPIAGFATGVANRSRRGSRPCASPIVEDVLGELDRRVDRPRARKTAHPANRLAAAGGAAARAGRARHRGAVPAHVLHRPSGHRQDHRRAAHGEDPASAGIRAPRAPGGGHARRPGGAVRRAIPRPRPRRFCKRPWAECCSSTRPTTCYRAENERDYGQEAIEILLQFMENRRDDLVVILAGYKDRMESVLPIQSGPAFAHCAPHRLSRLLAGRADGHRGADGQAADVHVRRPPRGRRSAEYLATARRPAAFRQRAQRAQCHGPHQAAAGGAH